MAKRQYIKQEDQFSDLKKRELEAKKNYKPEFIFQKKNYTFLFIGLAILILGFALMSGGGSDDPTTFDPEVYNWRRIRLAPTIVLIGFAVEFYAILLNPWKDKGKKNK